MLAAPIAGKSLILYTTALERSLGALLTQENEKGKENALYYLSRMLVGVEHSYLPVEKHCLALIFAVKKLRHYMLVHKIVLISKVDPLKFLMLTGRLARWAIALTEFDIVYMPQKAIKGQALADFLAAHPVADDSPLSCEFPDEETLHTEDGEPLWEMYFDGASSIRLTPGIKIPKISAGVGLVFVTPNGGITRHSISLSDPCTNNEAEYEALIAGLEIAMDMGIKRLHVYGDSKLIIEQVVGRYKVNKAELVNYQRVAANLAAKFPSITFERVSRALNGRADALARVAKELAEPNEDNICIRVRNRTCLASCFPRKESTPLEESKCEDSSAEVSTVEDGDWRQPFISYFQNGELPRERAAKEQLKRRALRFLFTNDTLYRKSYDQMWLRCVSLDEAKQIIEEVHSGICGAHQSGPKMKMKIKRLGYYWPSMVKDCIDYAKKCHLCQIHGDFIHQHPNALHPTVASWPFEMWGTDIVGPIDPPSSRGHRFILVAIDYFSKWAEAIPLRETKAEDIIRFFKTHILYRFGNPRRIISDNGPAFRSFKVSRFAEHHKIEWKFSTIYNPRANGLAEAFNKTLIGLLRKMVDKNHRNWHEKLNEALWAYRITCRTPTQATPYSLVFGSEAVLPLEVEIPSLRVAVHEGLSEDEQMRLRLEELEAVDEVRLNAQQNLELYRARMERAYNKMAKIRTFRKGELVLALKRPIMGRHVGPKFSGEGPYAIEKVYDGGAYLLVDQDRERPMLPINRCFLKKYYA